MKGAVVFLVSAHSLVEPQGGQVFFMPWRAAATSSLALGLIRTMKRSQTHHLLMARRHHIARTSVLEVRGEHAVGSVDTTVMS